MYVEIFLHILARFQLYFAAFCLIKYFQCGACMFERHFLSQLQFFPSPYHLLAGEGEKRNSQRHRIPDQSLSLTFAIEDRG